MSFNSDYFDLIGWKLTLPVDSRGGTGGSAFEIKQLTGYESAYFYDAPDHAMVFRAAVDGATTGGSNYARAELREMNGSQLAAWTVAEGGSMSATLRVDQVPTKSDGTPGRVIVSQIHGQSNELLRLYWENGTIYFMNDRAGSGNTETKFVPVNANGQQASISLGENFSYKITVKDNVLDVELYADGSVYSSRTTINSVWMTDHLYFKAGVYLGVNENGGSGSGQVSFYALDYRHDGNDTLSGTGGDDLLRGDARNDQLVGDAGNDTLYGGAGSDQIYGDSGNDFLRGDGGNDVLHGGTGFDTVSFQFGTGATIDVVAGSATDGEGGTDTFANVEQFIGSAYYRDVFTASGLVQYFAGLGGNDYVIDNGDGADVFNGGDGFDTVSFFNRAAVSVNLAAGNAVIGSEITMIIGFEQVYGSNTAGDTLIGDNGNNTLWGFGGSDILVGGKGLDTLSGGLGNDIFAFSAADLQVGVWDVISDFHEVANSDRDILYFNGVPGSSLLVGEANGGVYVSTTALGGNGGIFISNFTATQLSDQLMFT